MTINTSTLSRYKLDVLIFSLGVLFLTVGLFNAYHTISYNSDDVAQKLLVHEVVSSRSVDILTPPDNFVLKVPINVAIDSLVHDPSKNLFVTAWVMNVLGLLGFFVAGLYFVGKYAKNNMQKWFFYLPFLLLCSNNSTIFLYDIRSPQIRTLEIGIAFVSLVVLDQFISRWANGVTRNYIMYFLLATLLLGLFVYSDPAFIIMLLAPVVLSGLLVWWRRFDPRLGLLLTFVAGIYIVYTILGAIFTVLGIHTYHIPAEFVSWANLGSNISIALQGLLALFNASIFGLPLFKVGTFLILCNLVLLVLALVYIPKKITEKGEYWLAFFALQPLFLFSAYFLSTNVIDVASSRYLILLPFYAAIILAIGIHRLSRPYANLGRLICVALALLTLMQFILESQAAISNRAGQPNAYALNAAHVLSDLGVVKGYAPYWNAAINSYYSGFKVNIFPIMCDVSIRPDYWVVNKTSLTSQAPKSFLIVSNQNTEPGSRVEAAVQDPNCSSGLAIREFGQPVRIVRITDYADAYVYNYDILKVMPAGTNPH